MINFMSDRRGGSEAVAFAVVLILLMLIMMNLLPPIRTAFLYSNLTHVHRQTLLRMEVAGGLSPDIEQKAREELIQLGFDNDQIDVNGTSAVVDYGETVQLNIRYTYTYNSYAFSDFLIYPVNMPRIMEAAGSSVSFNFEK